MTQQTARVIIRIDSDVVLARQRGRELAAEVGFSGTDLTLIATAISEIARNIVCYARQGEVVLNAVVENGRKGVRVTARDEGPGIPDVDQALLDGFSTGRSLGLGLPGAKRLMDEFQVKSTVGVGTVVTMSKWVRT